MIFVDFMHHSIICQEPTVVERHESAEGPWKKKEDKKQRFWYYRLVGDMRKHEK